MLYAAALLILWLVPIPSTVTNDLSRLPLHATTTRMGELPCTTTNDSRHAADAVANRGAGQGQTAVLDLSQRSLALKLLSQQQINHVAHLAELPYRKQECLVLQAAHGPYARVLGLDAPSTHRSKSKKSARQGYPAIQAPD